MTKHDGDDVAPARSKRRGLSSPDRGGPFFVARDVSAAPPRSGNGSRHGSDPLSIFDADVPVVDLRKVLAETSRRRSRLATASRRPWLAVLVLWVLVMTAIGIIWSLAGPSPSDTAAPSVTAAVTPEALALLPTVPVTTTIPPATTAPPVTTTIPPATTAPPTTTLTVTTVPAFIEPVGAGISLNLLPLHFLGMGPLRLGDDADEVLGSLAASLGQPNGDTGPVVSQGEHGTCPGDEIREVQWGPLVVVSLTDSDAAATFHGYRVDGRLPDATGLALELETLSGLQIGDTVATLEDIYAGSYTISLTEGTPDGPTFEIRGGSTVLLRGPLTSLGENGTVQGIFSAAECEA